jgi:serine/threonine protein kinase
MPPEYVIHGRYSVKSDVFSFGVLVLEIISGKKNSSFYKSELDEDLLSYVSMDRIIQFCPDFMKNIYMGNKYFE